MKGRKSCLDINAVATVMTYIRAEGIKRWSYLSLMTVGELGRTNIYPPSAGRKTEIRVALRRWSEQELLPPTLVIFEFLPFLFQDPGQLTVLTDE